LAGAVVGMMLIGLSPATSHGQRLHPRISDGQGTVIRVCPQGCVAKTLDEAKRSLPPGRAVIELDGGPGPEPHVYGGARFREKLTQITIRGVGKVRPVIQARISD